jgi:putative SOS response-associated peptidase YedK
MIHATGSEDHVGRPAPRDAAGVVYCERCPHHAPLTPRADGEPITFAGLWDAWKDRGTGETLKSCTMIITEPNDFVAKVHDRMPVILERENFAARINDGGTALLKPAQNDILQSWPVSRRVNSSRAPDDDPTLIEPISVNAPAA